MKSPHRLLATTALALGTLLLAAGVRNVTVKKPGTLASKIGDSKYAVTQLKVKGTLDAADVRLLRDMAGGDTLLGRTPGRLVDIDLSEVEFQPGPEPITSGKYKYRITGRHTLPASLFYNCPVERLVLPARLDSIGSWALQRTRLTDLVIPAGVVMGKFVVARDSALRTLRLPDIHGQVPALSGLGLPVLRSIRYGDVDYISAGSFDDLPEVEEIVFDGLVGHMDGYLVTDCPKLKRIIFNGPVASTGGRQFVKNCPELEEVAFNGLVFATGFGKPVDCPKLTGYTQGGMVLYGDTACFRTATPAQVAADPEMRRQAEALLAYKRRALTKPSVNFLRAIESDNFAESDTLAQALGDRSFAADLGPEVLPIRRDMAMTKLDLLKSAPPYAPDTVQVSWTYAAPSDSLLALDREYFNLDSVAGTGDDISRIRNLLCWVHDLVRHDGSSDNPRSQTLIDMYELCRSERRGVNCRMMAIMLTEVLLAEGIPARYLTCQPKLYDFDSDCHVICVAWSDSLRKWVWVDPTFAAYVTDENGLMLHPGEVRERLRTDKPLVLNPDANWNHEAAQTKEDYLDRYMAKNLYYIEAVAHNCPRPEGRGAMRPTYVVLIPEGMRQAAPDSDVYTTDYDTFWQAPDR